MCRKNMNVTFKNLATKNIYLVNKSFTDANGIHIEKGQSLYYLKTEFLPYDEEYTLIFKEKEISLNENLNHEIINKFSEYFIKKA